MLRLNNDVGFETSAAVIEAIEAKAKVLWGEHRWLVDLTRKWCELYHPDGDTNTAFRNKRSQLGRTFDNRSCNLETAIQLANCVGAELVLLDRANNPSIN